ncbi:4Fe-4S dicluster domain-containing protein [Aureibacter tunicatorum]|uniref:Molybdopterin-containing oxidoreductase family iron-sulfur binding subunit n=1 Tax=Aureibacter tunicatorum TaxID=866807 RepID=A0AAE3XGB3_9BACT|nr:4Fe-4S dicluster domain-containing protein [Aureibacter tunicatorum]MDR6237066.1 molybdopterin-containing oxidoreductase family iron-sulfur binding subunit [Aureibacter tunicatorum]BDD06058.1 hypothetical protein AUTU_35410 [Aureibacter tunicatorum]
MSGKIKEWFALLTKSNQDQKQSHGGCGSSGKPCSCKGGAGEENKKNDGYDQVLGASSGRRGALQKLTSSLMIGAGAVSSACSVTDGKDKKELSQIEWEEYFKGNYRLMSSKEKQNTVDRLTKSYEIRKGDKINLSAKGPEKDVLYGYAFNISKCQGYMDCVNACVEENNQDRASEMQYIRIHEIGRGNGIDFMNGDDTFYHEVPAAGHFYVGTQCFHCDNPPCVDVCPVNATWKEKDGIVVIDYDWCIGCRYCMAACPYDGRRFNWKTPEVPEEEVNKDQHYLGNRLRKNGVMEKCTFCIQRSREGENPACVEACPTGARVFGNLLDPNSDIRWIIENKNVFRLKEDLGTEPKFWYYMD